MKIEETELRVVDFAVTLPSGAAVWCELDPKTDYADEDDVNIFDCGINASFDASHVYRNIKQEITGLTLAEVKALRDVIDAAISKAEKSKPVEKAEWESRLETLTLPLTSRVFLPLHNWQVFAAENLIVGDAFNVFRDSGPNATMFVLRKPSQAGENDITLVASIEPIPESYRGK